MFILQKMHRYIVPTHLPYRNWNTIAKMLNVFGIIYALNILGSYMEIPQHAANAVGVGAVLLASAASEFLYNSRNWKGYGYTIAAIAAGVYIYLAGDAMHASEYSDYEFSESRMRANVCILLWLIADGILVPSTQPKEESAE